MQFLIKIGTSKLHAGIHHIAKHWAHLWFQPFANALSEVTNQFPSFHPYSDLSPDPIMSKWEIYFSNTKEGL